MWQLNTQTYKSIDFLAPVSLFKVMERMMGAWRSLMGKCLRSNWRLEQHTISVCFIAILTGWLNIEPVTGRLLQNDYSCWKTKSPFPLGLLYLCNVSHVSSEINSNIHSARVCCAFLCVPGYVCVGGGLVAELMISARVFFFSTFDCAADNSS